MVFEPLRYDDGKLKSLPIANETVNKGEPLEFNSSGYLIPASSATSAGDVSFVAMEDADPSSGNPKIQVLHVKGVEFKATDDSGSLSQSNVGTKCGIADTSHKMNVSASGTTIFHLMEVTDTGNGVGKGYFIIS